MDEEYIKFKTTYVPYILPHVRNIYRAFDGRESLVTKVVRSLNDHPYNENEILSAKALLKVFNMMKSFRMPHKKLADQAYTHTKPADAKQRDSHSDTLNKTEERTKGSGGYSPQILDYILQLTLQNSDRVENALYANRITLK